MVLDHSLTASKKGVEFKGGRSYTVQFAHNVNVDSIRNPLHLAFKGDYPVIKTVGDNKHINITTSYLKGVNNADSAVQARLYQGLKSQLPQNLTEQEFAKKQYSEFPTGSASDFKRS